MDIFLSPISVLNNGFINENEFSNQNLNQLLYNDVSYYNDENNIEIRQNCFTKGNHLNDENLDENNYLLPEVKIFPNENIENVKTKFTSKTLGKEMKKLEDDDVKYINKIKEEKIKAGRKKKGEKDKGKHTKHCEDNMIRKIKSNFSIYSHNLINQSLKNKNIKFFKLDSEINKNLKKDYNINLMNTQFKDLYKNSSLSRKYRKQKIHNFEINKKLIIKLYNDETNKEIDAIKLLNLTYIEFFKKFREEYLEEFLKIIRNEENKNNESEENIRKYVDSIKNLCFNFENWFIEKKGRNREKKI